MKRRLHLASSITFFALTMTLTVIAGWKVSTTFLPDFSIFYTSAQDLVKGISPYADTSLFTAFNYPLATSFLFIPLSLLPYQWSQVVFTVANILSVFCIVYLCFVLAKKRLSVSPFLIITSFIFLSFPTKFTIGMGQTNILSYALLLTAFVFFEKKKQLVSVGFFILAVLLKPVLGLTLFVFLFEKQWKFFFAVFFSTLLCIVSVPLLFRQPFANITFFYQLTGQTLNGRETYYNQGLLGFISRLTKSIDIRKFLYTATAFPFIILFVQKIQKSKLVEKLSLAVTLLLILDPLSWQHHFVFLVLPFFTTFLAIQKIKQKKYIYYALLCISYVLLSWNIKNPAAFSRIPFSLLLSHELYGALLLFFLQVKMM